MPENNKSVKELIEFLKASQTLAKELKKDLADGKLNAWEAIGRFGNVRDVVEEDSDIKINQLLATSMQDRLDLIQYIFEQPESKNLNHGVVVWLIEAVYVGGNLGKALQAIM